MNYTDSSTGGEGGPENQPHADMCSVHVAAVSECSYALYMLLNVVMQVAL